MYSKKKLNEEFSVILEEGPIMVGIVEYEDEPWLPFMFDNDPEHNTSESELYEDNDLDELHGDDENSETNDNEDENIPNTNMEETEEGEIRDEVNTPATTTPTVPSLELGNELMTPIHSMHTPYKESEPNMPHHMPRTQGKESSLVLIEDTSPIDVTSPFSRPKKTDLFMLCFIKSE
ncbi:unnamed protein product [Lactuca saligna]|uniref:Uncharacterized protein n=1 Tax=Lactuca saligna TaxID=75948 RepID=A0AA35ZV68_LACSI|nr:unnamed protein product [Lactuca saligna]